MRVMVLFRFVIPAVTACVDEIPFRGIVIAHVAFFKVRPCTQENVTCIDHGFRANQILERMQSACSMALIAKHLRGITSSFLCLKK